ncbi:hypothetical protein CHS0354_003222, partial [Potamilus streckersoni]
IFLQHFSTGLTEQDDFQGHLHHPCSFENGSNVSCDKWGSSGMHPFPDPFTDHHKLDQEKSYSRQTIEIGIHSRRSGFR